MNKKEKNQFIDELAEKLNDSNIFYLADVSKLTVEVSNKLRRECFRKDVSLQVVKNTLLKKAMEKVDGKSYDELYDVLKGNTSVMFTDTANAPAKLIKEFRKKSDRPLLKAAFIEEQVYIGDNQIEALASLKSKEEVIGDIIGLLQSPAKNVISALQSGKSTLAGLVKTLSERPEGASTTKKEAPAVEQEEVKEEAKPKAAEAKAEVSEEKAPEKPETEPKEAPEVKAEDKGGNEAEEKADDKKSE